MRLRADQRHPSDGRPRPLAAAVAILMVASQASTGLRRRGERASGNARAGPARRWRRRLVLALAAVLMLAACGGTGDQSAGGGTPTLNWYIFHDVSGSFPADAAACSAASGGEYTIQIRELPAAADGQREQLVRRSAAKDSSLDILGLDVVWEAEFAEAGWIQPWTGQRRRQVTQDAVKAALDTATWKGQLVAAPFNSNTQLLWSRKASASADRGAPSVSPAR
jgi:ABC-type glycerol-3-phosphate transport system substrate-binding protein